MVLLRKVAVHDRRLRALGGVVDRVRVLEPGGVAGQLAEARKALGVDPVVLVHQRVRGQLVEQHHHDRGARHAADRARLGLVRERQLRDLAAQEEQQEENERDGRQDVQERAHRLGARPQDRDRGADRQREHDQHGVRGVERLLERLGGDQRHEHAEERDVGAVAHLRPDQPEQELDPEQDRRRQRHQQHGEAHDVEPGRPARSEELRVVLQEVE